MKNPLSSKPEKPPEDVLDRINRGRIRMRNGAPLANECLRFWRGDQYIFRDRHNQLISQGTLFGEKDPHRIRQTRNPLIDIVARETAAMTQRIPEYEVTPSTTDQEDIDAARLATKVASYGHDKWDIDEVVERVVEYAILTGEGFAWPYFDNTVGDAIDDEVATGEVSIRVYGRNEVFWEPDVRFKESRWHAVEQAVTIESLEQSPGFIGGTLQADAASGDSDSSRSDKSQTKLVLRCDYLERPSPKNPKGRWITIANERQVFKPRDYPCLKPRKIDPTDPASQPGFDFVDEPCLHKLSYITDPELDRDMGLVEHMLDGVRTWNDCTNKQLEWKNLALLPQMVGPPGALRSRITDKPGAYIEAIPINGVLPQWRQVPPIPAELGQLKQDALADLLRIAGQDALPSQIESGKGVEAFYGEVDDRRYTFVKKTAKWYSRLMRHCLYLVQRHYTEPRLLHIRGRNGPEMIDGFLGADMCGEADVHVAPSSIEPRTRRAIEQRVMNWAQLGWITAQQAMVAINNGTAAGLVESYERDISRAELVIRKMKAFGTTGTELPAPRKGIDNLAVHRTVIADWAKTTDFDAQLPEVQEAALTYLEALDMLEQEELMRKTQQQAMAAESAGMANAARPQDGGKPMPSMPALPE